MPQVCVDASLILLWFLREDLSPEADALLEKWRAEGTNLIAPPNLMAEVPSVLRQAVYRGRITLDEGDVAFAAFLDADVRILQPQALLTKAWDLGKTLNAPRLYDMYYLALAEIEGCELWTADRRLANLVQPRFPQVHWLGEAP